MDSFLFGCGKLHGCCPNVHRCDCQMPENTATRTLGSRHPHRVPGSLAGGGGGGPLETGPADRRHLDPGVRGGQAARCRRVLIDGLGAALEVVHLDVVAGEG